MKKKWLVSDAKIFFVKKKKNLTVCIAKIFSCQSPDPSLSQWGQAGPDFAKKIFMLQLIFIENTCIIMLSEIRSTFELRYERANILHVREQRCRSAPR